MKKAKVIAVVLAAVSVSALAAKDQAEIKLRDMKIDGLMGVNTSLSVTGLFDVRGNDLLDELTFDFYVLLEPRDKDLAKQFMHCRTIHRFLEKASGYTSGVVLDQSILKCIDPRDTRCAVVVTYKGKEVGLENSEKNRWWEDEALGKPIENILSRFASATIVREWESVK